VASIAVLGLLGTTVSPAAAERKDGKGLGGTARAAAFALDVDVDLIDALPLDVGPVSRLRLSGDAGPRFENLAKLEVPPLLEALVLATGAQTDTGDDLASKASARVATVKLKLLGELLIKLVKSECSIKDNVVNIGSDLVFADGSVLGIGIDAVGLAARPNSRIDIPLVGSLILNEQKIEKRVGSKSGRVNVTVNAVRLELDGILGSGNLIIAQSVCKVSGPGVGKDLKVVSMVNGNDTSDQVDDDHEGQLLGGLLGDLSLLRADSLLGNSLLGGGGLGGLL
jgi:hypothetical protein